MHPLLCMDRTAPTLRFPLPCFIINRPSCPVPPLLCVVINMLLLTQSPPCAALQIAAVGRRISRRSLRYAERMAQIAHERKLREAFYEENFLA